LATTSTTASGGSLASPDFIKTALFYGGNQDLPFIRRELDLVAFFADDYRLAADHDFWTSVAVWTKRVPNFVHSAPPDYSLDSL